MPGVDGVGPAWSADCWFIALTTEVARRDGSALLKAFNGHPSVAWTPDSQALVFVEDGELHRFGRDAMASVNAEKRAHERHEWCVRVAPNMALLSSHFAVP